MVAAHVNQENVEAVMLRMFPRRDVVLGWYFRATRNHYEVWVVTQPLTPEQELDVYGIAAMLRGELPGIDFDLYIEHSGMYAGDANPFDAVPPDARRFVPHPA